jgi:hypothetical protein
MVYQPPGIEIMDMFMPRYSQKVQSGSMTSVVNFNPCTGYVRGSSHCANGFVMKAESSTYRVVDL